VLLQRELDQSYVPAKLTDANGEAEFRGLPAGSYKYRVTAANHQEKIGRIWIKPGLITTEPVFLDYNLVTVEWSVTETTIQDKYEVVLTTTYETNVPAAVVVASPTSVNLPPMRAGDVFNGEFTLSNHGLVRADNVVFELPADDGFFHYELMSGLPTSLAAHEQVRIPYKVVCLKSPDQSAGGNGSGGGCSRYTRCVIIRYVYKCAHGEVTAGSSRYCVIYDNGECKSAPVSGGGTGGGGASGGGGYVNIGWSGGTSSGYSGSPAPPPAPLPGQKCLPCLLNRPPCLPCTLKRFYHELVGSYVDLLMGGYTDEVTDLGLKSGGVDFSVKRILRDGAWRFDFEDYGLKFRLKESTILGQVRHPDGAGGGDLVTSPLYDGAIESGGIIYERITAVPQPLGDDRVLPLYTVLNLPGMVFAFGHESSITVTDSGYRWRDRKGRWREYDKSGRLLSSGDHNGLRRKYIYRVMVGGQVLKCHIFMVRPPARFKTCPPPPLGGRGGQQRPGEPGP
jgi:hypothetical protein